MKSKNVILTGASGFLGGHLLRQLLKENYYVLATCTNSTNLKKFDGLNQEKCTFINIEEKNIKELFVGKVDAVIHTATTYGRGAESVQQIVSSNIALPVELYKESIKNCVPLFINTDSYFNKPYFTYKHLPDYSASKRALLNWLEMIKDNVDIINLRLEHVYGPNDDLAKFIPNAINSIAINGLKYFRATHGNQKRDFVFVADVVEAFMAVLQRYTKIESGSGKFSIYEVGTNESTEIRMVLEQIKFLSNSDTEILFGALNYRPDEIMESKANLDFNAEFDWSARFNLNHGLNKTINSFRKSNN